MQYTVLLNDHATQATPYETSWNDFCNTIEQVPAYPSKKAQPLLKLARFENDSRAVGASLKSIHGIELDYDNGIVTAAEAARLLEQTGLTAIVHSSYSSTPEFHKWRAFIPLSKPAPAKYRHACVTVVDEVLGSILARESYTPKQIFYFGKNPDSEYTVIRTEGQPLDKIPALQKKVSTYFKQQQEEKLKAPVTTSKRPASLDGQISVIDQFNSTHTVHDILQQREYKFVGGKYLAPNSTSGRAGVSVLAGDDGVERVYSHHNDVLNNGHACDAFDCYALLVHGGDVNSAIESAGDSLLTETGQTVTAFNRQVYANLAQACEKKRFTFTSGDELFIQRPINWLVEGAIEVDTFASIFGASGSGKSFAAIDMSLCIATGQNWHGHDVKQGGVAYIAGEGKAGLKRRVAAWTQRYGSEEDVKKNFFLSDGLPLLPEEADDFIGALKELPDLRLLVLDTLQRVFIGDENSTKDMTAFVAAVDKVRHAIPDLVVMAIHHTGHAAENRARGSSVLRASLDVEISMVEKDDLRILKQTKAKDSEPFKPLAFTLETEELDWGGETICSATLHLDHSGITSMTPPKAKGDKQQVALDVLGAMTDEFDPDTTIDQWCRACNKDERFSYQKPSTFKARMVDTLSAANAVRVDGERVTLV